MELTKKEIKGIRETVCKNCQSSCSRHDHQVKICGASRSEYPQ